MEFRILVQGVCLNNPAWLYTKWNGLDTIKKGRFMGNEPPRIEESVKG